MRHLRLRGTNVSFLQIVTWDGERSWWRRRGRLQAAGAERGALRRRADLGGQRGTERGGGLSARSPGAATTSGSIRASRLEVRASLRQLEPRRPRLAAAVPGPTCRGREGGCGPAAMPGLRGPRGAAPVALGRAVPSPACRGREGRRAASAPRPASASAPLPRPATPPHCGTLQCRTPLRPAALARYRISRGRRMRPPPERRVGRG